MTSIELSSSNPARIRANAIVIGVLKKGDGIAIAPDSKAVSTAYGRTLARALTALGATGDAGQVTRIPKAGSVAVPGRDRRRARRRRTLAPRGSVAPLATPCARPPGWRASRSRFRQPPTDELQGRHRGRPLRRLRLHDVPQEVREGAQATGQGGHRRHTAGPGQGRRCRRHRGQDHCQEPQPRPRPDQHRAL